MKSKKKVILILLAVILAITAFVLWKNKSGGGQTLSAATDFATYSSITSKVEGSGLSKARNSETLSLTTSGTVMDVYVAEGDEVHAGDPLFLIDSPAAETEVSKAREQVKGYQSQYNSELKNLAGLNLSAPYKCKLTDVLRLSKGDKVYKNTRVATLIDDSTMRLVQYYSYAYEGDIYAGQKMQVSIPVLMTTVEGTVDKVNMISRITPEGSKLFSAEIKLENKGILTEGMTATATASANGEEIYPYEDGKLEYNRTGELLSTVEGTVISSELLDYLEVQEGQVLLRLEGDDAEGELFGIKESLENAQKNLENAEKNLANCKAVAPIDGKIIGLNTIPGQEIQSGTGLVTISDTSSLVINATVDERNISYIKPGMSVDLDQWGTMAWGTVESVSLNSTINGGVATYPIVIVADNMDGQLQVNSYINYSLIASQSENCLVVPIQAVKSVTTIDGETVDAVYVKGSRPDNALELMYEDEQIPEGFWPVQVEIGISDNYNVEIRSGLEEGAEVFTQLIRDSYWG